MHPTLFSPLQDSQELTSETKESGKKEIWKENENGVLCNSLTADEGSVPNVKIFGIS